MPVTTTTEVNPDIVEGAEFDESSLLGEDGKLTLEAETIAVFLEDVNYDVFFDDPELKGFVIEETQYFTESSDAEDAFLFPADDAAVKEAESADDDAEIADRKIIAVECEVIPGEIVAELIDEDDLYSMLEYYVVHEMPVETLEDKAALAEFSDVLSLVDDSELDERKAPFKKGDFRKGPFKGASGGAKGGKLQVHNQRKRMMVAMLKKGAIVRVAKGKGYRGGDYKPGYGPGGASGSPSKNKIYQKMRAKGAKKAGKIKALVDPGRKKVIKVIYKNLGAKMPKPWVPPEKRLSGKTGKKGSVSKKLAKAKGGGKKAAAMKKAAGLFKGKKGGKGKTIAASVEQERDPRMQLSEGSSLAASALQHQRACADKAQEAVTIDETKDE